MKIIDLLNKIANEEEVPKHIHIRGVDKYTWQEDVKAYWSDRDENNLLSDLDLSSTNLKEDIEIIEDTLEENKIPEKLTQFEAPFLKGDKPDIRFSLIIDQINDLIDYLKSKGE